MGVQDTLDIISAANATISTRLHSSIFSTIAGTPFIDILHHDKNYGFIRSIDKEGWSTWLWNYDIEQVKHLLVQFLDKDDKDTDLLAFTSQAREKLADVASIILR